MTLRHRFLVSVAAGLLAASAATAHEYEVGTLTVAHPWARAMPPGAEVGGGYLTVTNNGTEPDRLTGGSAESVGAVEIHQSSLTDGVARMRKLGQGLEIAPGETVTLQPGGTHIMFIDPQQPLRNGDRLAAELRFEKAGAVEVEFAIMPIGAPSAEGHDEMAAGEDG